MPSAAEMQAAVLRSPVLRRSRGLFLRISAVVTIALIPIIVFIELTRRESLESRAGTLLDTAALVADDSLRESIADSDMLLKALAMDDQSSSPGETGTQGRRRWIMQSAIHAHARYSSVRLYSNQGEALLEADRYVPAIAPTPSATRLPAELLTLAKRLSADQAWMSSLLWPIAPRSRGPRQAEPYFLLLRPLVNRKGVHRGILAIVIRLGSVMREMDQILNQAEGRQQGYVVSNDGTVLNPSGRARTTNFAITYPELWERLKEKERGRGDSHGKLFLFRRERPLDASVTQSAGFTVGLVMQVQTTGLDHGQGLGPPAEISLVGLLYLVVAGASLAIAAEQEKLAEGRLQEQELHRRLQMVIKDAGVGMALCDPSDDRIVSANAALCTFFERTEHELQQLAWEELSHPDDRLLDRQLRSQLQQGAINSYRLRRRYLSASKATLTGDLIVTATRDPNGNLSDLIVQIFDLTDLVTKSSYLEAASSAGIIGVWDWDVQRNQLTWDPVMYRLYGLSKEDFRVTYEGWARAVHPDDRSFVVEALHTAMAGGNPYDCQFRVVWPDGSLHHIRARGDIQFASDGTALRVVGVNYDVTELAESEERFRLLAENITDVLFITKEDCITWIAPGIQALLGWEPAQWIGTNLATFSHPEDQSVAIERQQLVDSGARLIYRLRVRDAQHCWRWIEVHAGPYCDPHGHQQGTAGALWIVDQEVASEAELDRRARIDALTGLLNRTEIFERLDVLKQADRRHSGDVGILFCDIDHFKAINDTHGHAGGDAVLQILATRIQHSIRSNDLVARLGGDELMVVLTGISNLTEVESIAEKIHQSVQQPLDLPTGKVVPTLSIGVTLIGHDEPIDAVVARADAAMYEAKQHGRNRVVTFG